MKIEHGDSMDAGQSFDEPFEKLPRALFEIAAAEEKTGREFVLASRDDLLHRSKPMTRQTGHQFQEEVVP